MHIEKIKHCYKRAITFYKLLERDYLREKVNFSAEYFVTDEPVPFTDIRKYKMAPISLGQTWGKDWQCSWIHLVGTVPEDWRGRKIMANIDIGGEGLIYDNNGIPLQGLTNGSVFRGHFYRFLFPVYDS